MKDDYIDYAEDYGILKIERAGETEFYVAEKIDVQETEYIFGVIDRQFDDMGVINYRIDKKSKDYFDIMHTFYDAVCQHFQQIRKEETMKPDGKLNHHDCLPIYNFETLKGKIVVLKSDALYREYRSIAHQLYLADGGFGCSPKGRGNAIYAYNLYTGKKTRIEKYDVIGVIKDEKMPQWAKEKLVKLKQKIRESKETVR